MPEYRAPPGPEPRIGVENSFPCSRPSWRDQFDPQSLAQRANPLPRKGWPIAIMSVLSCSTLQLPVDDLASLGIIVGRRLIRDGDEYALLPEEADILAGSVIERRRASGAARILVRELLAQLGCSQTTALPKSTSGAPVWPTGIIGSLAHDSRFAIAAVGRRDDVVALGIDIEPAESLPFELDLIATPRERLAVISSRYGGRLLFTAKEAVYKAVYPLDGIFLEHHDVEIDFDSCKAIVHDRHVLDLRFGISESLVTLAFIPNSE